MDSLELKDYLRQIDCSLPDIDTAGEEIFDFIHQLSVFARDQISCSQDCLCPSECHDIDTLLRAVDLLIERRFLRNAEFALIGILIVHKSPSSCMRRLAEIYEIESDYKRTSALARRLLSKYPGEPEVVYQLSFALYKLECFDEALEYLIPLVIQEYSQRVYRLYGLTLKSLGQISDAIDVFTKAIEHEPNDIYCIRALSEIYVDLGLHRKALELVQSISDELAVDDDKILQSVIFRSMGELDHAILLNDSLIEKSPLCANAYWTQCFNYSISTADYSSALLETSCKFWELTRRPDYLDHIFQFPVTSPRQSKVKIGFLSSDIGEHVVSRFLAPILRNYDKTKYHITILSASRRFEEKATDIAALADEIVCLQGMEALNASMHLRNLSLDIIIDTNGFTKNSGLPLLSLRCAPIQCHYIGYHASTGLSSIDYFLGDAITVPNEFQHQYVERLIQIPSLWMAYDSCLDFPDAFSAAKLASPILGSFSQVAKINNLTLKYWAAAMKACPASVLVIKDRGMNCQTTLKRIERALSDEGVDPDRVYPFGPVYSQTEHLGCYNAIDIALDTTPWSGATTAFEALGMGVPLVSICGDTTSGRMSASVVNAAGMSHLITHSVDEFAHCVSELAQDYMNIRGNKAKLQTAVRSSILFDEQRITRDFFSTIDRLHKDYYGSA